MSESRRKVGFGRARETAIAVSFFVLGAVISEGGVYLRMASVDSTRKEMESSDSELAIRIMGSAPRGGDAFRQTGLLEVRPAPQQLTEQSINQLLFGHLHSSADWDDSVVPATQSVLAFLVWSARSGQAIAPEESLALGVILGADHVRREDYRALIRGASTPISSSVSQMLGQAP